MREEQTRRHIHVRVKANARKELIEEGGRGTVRISVKEKAERGAANARVRELLATHFGIEEKKFRLIKGAQSPSKVYLVYS
jgi:uncharacterized protein YggU (UPF0235/DUF167 family)